MRRENYKSDLELEVILTLGGVEIPVPDHDFMLVFRTAGKRVFICMHKGDSWVNCKVVDGRLRCYLDNHGLGVGRLRCEYYDYLPDSDFRDGNQLKVVPHILDVELIYGAGDDAASIPIELATDITEAIARANAISADLEHKRDTDYYRGVSVESIIQTTTTHDDGGENIITVTLTNGEQYTFSVFNGGGTSLANYYNKQQVDARLESKATLVDGKVPLSQLPDMVDDVLDGRYKDGQFFPAEYNPDLPDYIPDVEPYTPVRGKLYVDTSNDRCYRWNGEAYVEVVARGVIFDGSFIAEYSLGDVVIEKELYMINRACIDENYTLKINGSIASIELISKQRPAINIYTIRYGSHKVKISNGRVTLIQDIQEYVELTQADFDEICV